MLFFPFQWFYLKMPVLTKLLEKTAKETKVSNSMKLNLAQSVL